MEKQANRVESLGFVWLSRLMALCSGLSPGNHGTIFVRGLLLLRPEFDVGLSYSKLETPALVAFRSGSGPRRKGA